MVPSLPWPVEWSAPGPGAWAVLGDGFLALIALGLVWLGVSELAAGRPENAVLPVAGAVYLGTLTAVSVRMWHLRRPGSPRSVTLRTTGSGPEGVSISCSVFMYCSAAVLLVMSSAGLALLTASLVPAAGDWEPFTSPSGAIDVGSGIAYLLYLGVIAFSGAVALLCLWLFLEMATGRIALGRLVLGPDGIHHRSQAFEHFVPWHAVVDVEAAELVTGATDWGLIRSPHVIVTALPTEDTRVRRTAWWARRFLEFTFLPSVVVNGRRLAVDPAVAYHALRYYHAHPEMRAELRTPAGVQRIRSGRLLDGTRGQPTAGT